MPNRITYSNICFEMNTQILNFGLIFQKTRSFRHRTLLSPPRRLIETNKINAHGPKTNGILGLDGPPP
jgi:hypothetical protein